MKRIGMLLGVMCMMVLMAQAKGRKTLRFFDLNIWQEGTIVKGGFEALADEVARVDADFVMFSEVRNYKNTRFCDRIVKALKERGLTYYSFYSYDSGLLSKYPLKDSATVYPCVDDHGSCYKLVTEVSGQRIAVYTAHLDYQSCAYYDVRGYDGNTWKRREPLTNVAQILEKNGASRRDDGIVAFVEDAQKERERGALVIIGGDFNEPSAEDWTMETATCADHHGAAVPWTVTSILLQQGYADAYRSLFPNVLTHPGYTYPADTEGASLKSLTWAPEADERERIDYIFFAPSPKWQLKRAYIVGPKGCIRKNQRVVDDAKDPICEPIGVWPSDHKGVVAELKMK